MSTTSTRRFRRAPRRRAIERRAVQNQFYGDRSGTLEDPFGHTWTVSTHVEDLSPEEMRASEQAMKQRADRARSGRGGLLVRRGAATDRASPRRRVGPCRIECAQSAAPRTTSPTIRMAGLSIAARRRRAARVPSEPRTCAGAACAPRRSRGRVDARRPPAISARRSRAAGDAHVDDERQAARASACQSGPAAVARMSGDERDAGALAPVGHRNADSRPARRSRRQPGTTSTAMPAACSARAPRRRVRTRTGRRPSGGRRAGRAAPRGSSRVDERLVGRCAAAALADVQHARAVAHEVEDAAIDEVVAQHDVGAPRSRAARKVSRSGSPGPAPTSQTGRLVRRCRAAGWRAPVRRACGHARVRWPGARSCRRHLGRRRNRALEAAQIGQARAALGAALQARLQCGEAAVGSPPSSARQARMRCSETSKQLQTCGLRGASPCG
jgi:hypothetical protein